MSGNMVEILYLVEVSTGWDSWQQKQVDGEIYTEHLIKGKPWAELSTQTIFWFIVNICV